MIASVESSASGDAANDDGAGAHRWSRPSTNGGHSHGSWYQHRLGRAPSQHRKVGLLASLVIVALIAVPASAFAGKGGGSSTPSWIALSSVGGAFAAAQPNLGSSVRFSSGYPTSTKNPWVSLTCKQGETMVYGEGGSPSSDFVLGGASSLWLEVGGAAACRAELGDLYWRGGHQYYTFLAVTNFDAGE
jgi:hypothetical protein